MSQEQMRIYTTEKCTGCNRCISACTVPEANYARIENGVNKIYIDQTKCINCAKCVEMCPHGARDYLDDTDAFLDRLAGGTVSLLVAPAARTNFPNFDSLLGTLRRLGAKNIYDVSFGADITTWGYIRHIQKTGAVGLVSQPCPAVVNYIEKHNPSLLPVLCPVQSPVMCGAIYMRKYKGIRGEIAFISPCIAKKDEFLDSNNGDMIQYNVTFKKLKEALERRGINYLTSPPDTFDNAQHGLGSLYPMPGGLKTCVHNSIPDAWVYQVEGQPEVKHFLDMYSSLPAGGKGKPFLVDILNCADGCNFGTGTECSIEDGISVSRTMYQQQQQAVGGGGKKVRFRKAKPLGTTLEQFDKELNLDDFIRRYADKLVPTIRVTERQVEQAYMDLYKETPEARHIDCCSCGYTNCHEMAEAVAKGINHVENCVEYHKSVQLLRQQEIEQMAASQEQQKRDLEENVEIIFNSISKSSKQSDETATQVSRINDDIAAVRDIAERLSKMVDSLSEQVRQYVSMGSNIVSISQQTNLLSINASVEAAHARELGKGFAVVAEKMKRLSEESANSAKEILARNEQVLPMLDEVRTFSESLDGRTRNIADASQEILEAVRSISHTEQEIAAAASQMSAKQDAYNNSAGANPAPCKAPQGGYDEQDETLALAQ